MVREEYYRKIKEDFLFLKEKVLGIVIFGSLVNGDFTGKSDIDVCIVSPNTPASEILSMVFQNVDVEKEHYDVKVFEELPLYLKAEVIRRYVVVIGDEGEIAEYFRVFWKIWKDQEHRQKFTKEELKRILSNKTL